MMTFCSTVHYSIGGFLTGICWSRLAFLKTLDSWLFAQDEYTTAKGGCGWLNGSTPDWYVAVPWARIRRTLEIRWEKFQKLQFNFETETQNTKIKFMPLILYSKKADF